MKAVKCATCESVWLSPAAERLAREDEVCLRCDGPLELMSAEETRLALEGPGQ